MKKIITAAVMFVVSLVSFSQNIIANGDFESGTAINLVGNPAAFTNNVPNWTPGCAGLLGGSPDIFDVSSTYCQYGVPANKNANNRQVHTAGTRRYAGMSGPESILGTITASLTAGEYQFKAYYAARQGYNYCNGNYTPNPQTVSSQLEIVLRNSSNPCGSGLVVYTGPITINSGLSGWSLFSGTFNLTSAQTGYDRIEIRQLNEQGGWMYIDDISLEKTSCPTDLELSYDCETGLLSVLNLPTGIQGTTTWHYKKKIKGAGSVILNSSTIVPSIPLSQGWGWYTVQMSFTLPNGVECYYSASFYFYQDYCCTVLGPQFEAVIAPSSIIGYQTVQTIPWGTQNLPIVSCNGFRVDLQTDCFATEPNTFYVGLSTFDPINWVGITSVYSNGNFNPATFPSLSSTEFATLQSNTWYILTVCVGSDCSYMVFRTNDCSAKNRVQEEVLNDELKVSLRPNPTKSVTNVELSESTTGVLIVSSISGEEVRRIEFFNSNSIDVDVTNLQVGVYILQVRSNDEVITTRLLKE